MQILPTDWVLSVLGPDGMTPAIYRDGVWHSDDPTVAAVTYPTTQYPYTLSIPTRYDVERLAVQAAIERLGPATVLVQTPPRPEAQPIPPETPDDAWDPPIRSIPAGVRLIVY